MGKYITTPHFPINPMGLIQVGQSFEQTGMWSLARVMASMEKEFGAHYPIRADAAFKLPIFMLAVITLGHEPAETMPGETPALEIESNENRINFELRDTKTGLPHLKGQFALNLKQ